MTSSWQQKAESHFTAGAAFSSERAMRPAKAIESGNHACPNTAYSSKRSKKGFTLIELIVVMLILAILVGIVIISIGGVISRGQETAYNADDEAIRIAVAAYYVLHTEWPTSDGEPGPIAMDNLTAPPGGELPYLDSIPVTASPANGGTGHYTWIVSAIGVVTSICTPDAECPDGTGDGYRGVYP